MDHLRVNVQSTIGQRKEMMRSVFSNAEKVKDYALRFLQGHGRFWVLDLETVCKNTF